MKFQPKGSPWCGPTALRNGLYNFMGFKHPLQKVIDACEPNPHADEHAIMRGIGVLGFNYTELRTNESKVARAWDLPCAIICVDNLEHWVTVRKLGGNLYMVIDSENVKSNKLENGVHTMSWRGLNRRWKLAGRLQTDKTDCTYYGVLVH